MIDGRKKLNSYEQWLSKSNLPTFKERQKRLDMIQMYKVLHDNYNVYPSEFPKLNDRSKRNFFWWLFLKSELIKKLGKNDLTFRIIDQRNDLPEQVVTAISCNHLWIHLLKYDQWTPDERSVGKHFQARACPPDRDRALVGAGSRTQGKKLKVRIYEAA